MAVKDFLSQAEMIGKSVETGSTSAPSPIGGALNAIFFPLKLQALYSIAKEFTNGKPSNAGNRLRELAKRTGFENKSVAEVIGHILWSPLTTIAPAPSGLVMFDVSNTSLGIRMVLKKDDEYSYHDQCTPVTLDPNTKYEVFFQVSTGVWFDVKEWSPKLKKWVTPTRTHTFSVDGSYSFRWFHLNGPWPLFVESVENANGPMRVV